ncbi:MAG: exodeoxyribonuclease I [Gammaproteobacteria bacterium]
MSGTIYWHDYETYGAKPSVDRPSQFAGIRTNTDLEIVGDPLMIYCKPVADMLPSVDACLITGITPQLADDKGLPEPEFIRRIHSEFIRPQTCGAGYNSLRFDDEVTRYTLYRNFYDPYAREWQNGNSRWDIIDMVRLTYALRPESLVWPERETGVPSFKLELLSAANKLEHESAHDALSDVLATIGLARLIKEREPGLFDYCWNARKKTEVSKKIDLRAHKPLVHVSSKIPASQGCTTIVMPLVMHPANKNAVICIDLCANINPLLDLNAEAVKERLYTRMDDLEESESRIPLKAIHLNRCPVILPLKMLEEAKAKRLGIDLSRAEANWQMLLQRAEELGKKAQFAFESSFEDNQDADAALYNGFIPDADRSVAEQVKNAPPEQLANQSFVFQDRRLNELLYRYKARHFPQALKDDERQLWVEQVRERLLEPDASGETRLGAYKADVQARLAEAGEKREILEALSDWADERGRLFAGN